MNTNQIDFGKARKNVENPYFSGFFEYSPAYCVTNEDLRTVIGFSDVKNKRVLTVTGSGDGPVFYFMSGAKKVDTFDLSYCAKVVMDIKTAAIPVLNLQQYTEMIFSLRNAKSTNEISHFQKINHQLPSDVKNFLFEMKGYKIFNNGLSPEYYARYLPTAKEYSKIQQMIKKPFNFKWANICDINNELRGQYDIINLSNIFQYIKSAETISKILKNLLRHLTSSGIIVAETTWFFRNFEMKKYIQVQDIIKNHAKMGMSKHQGQQSIIVKHR